MGRPSKHPPEVRREAIELVRTSERPFVEIRPPPAMLAKAAAILDRLSGGRVELGLGAGAFWEAIEAFDGERRSRRGRARRARASRVPPPLRAASESVDRQGRLAAVGPAAAAPDGRARPCRAARGGGRARGPR